MARFKEEKKIIETRALSAARNAGVPIPLGESPDEEPDFRFNGNTLGVEVSELLRPASSNFGIVPAAEENYHQEIIRMAQQQYYSASDARPAAVILYFANARGRKRNKQEMARVLAEFVKTHVPRDESIATFGPLRMPEGFCSISIAARSGDWWTGEGGGVTVSDIHEALASGISTKQKLLSAYRENLAPGAQVWLLLYTTVTVSRSMPIPHGINEWRFPFDFERVFWVTCLENHFVEIQRAEAVKAVSLSE
jgi:hypothetical protein